MRGARLRSWLFVPGDSERKQAKALDSSADALILDLEDSVAVEQLPAARERVRELLRARRDNSRQQLWVRVNPRSSGLLLADLTAVLPGAPQGIVIPKAESAREVAQIEHDLADLEARAGLATGVTQLLVIATETPAAVLNVGRYAADLAGEPRVRSRLAGLTWGAEDLSAALGVSEKTDADGGLGFTFRLARSLCVLSAGSLGVAAIDTVHVDFRDREGLQRDLSNARRDGFTGKLAIHPAQVELINTAFMPGLQEIERARRIVGAFAAAPGAGVVSLDGQMIDRPHLVQARRVLALAGVDGDVT